MYEQFEGEVTDDWFDDDPFLNYGEGWVDLDKDVIVSEEEE